MDVAVDGKRGRGEKKGGGGACSLQFRELPVHCDLQRDGIGLSGNATRCRQFRNVKLKSKKLRMLAAQKLHELNHTHTFPTKNAECA